MRKAAGAPSTPSPPRAEAGHRRWMNLPCRHCRYRPHHRRPPSRDRRIGASSRSLGQRRRQSVGVTTSGIRGPLPKPSSHQMPSRSPRPLTVHPEQRPRHLPPPCRNMDRSPAASPRGPSPHRHRRRPRPAHRHRSAPIRRHHRHQPFPACRSFPRAGHPHRPRQAPARRPSPALPPHPPWAARAQARRRLTPAPASHRNAPPRLKQGAHDPRPKE